MGSVFFLGALIGPIVLVLLLIIALAAFVTLIIVFSVSASRSKKYLKNPVSANYKGVKGLFIASAVLIVLDIMFGGFCMIFTVTEIASSFPTVRNVMGFIQEPAQGETPAELFLGLFMLLISFIGILAFIDLLVGVPAVVRYIKAEMLHSRLKKDNGQQAEN